jgi:hypothetical protein
MDQCVRNCVIKLTAVLLMIATNEMAMAASQYHIPDDCLGSWQYCENFRIKHFTDYGPYFTDDRRFLPDTVPPNLDDPFPSRIQPLSPSAGVPSESLRQ